MTRVDASASLSSQSNSATVAPLVSATVEAHCRALRLPTVAAQFDRLGQEATRAHQTHASYLATLLGAELEERERHTVERRIKEARLPRFKTLDEFDFTAASHIPAPLIRELSEGTYLNRAEPVLLIGDSGTGKTHLATGLCIAACQQKKRVRFVTAAGLVNELVEAQHHSLLSRALVRWSRYDLIVLDEVGYVPFAQIGAELLFQVVSERAERATLIITTNLPFSEWTQVFPSARLCKALLDRITDRAHIIETGTESYRFKRTMQNKRKGGAK